MKIKFFIESPSFRRQHVWRLFPCFHFLWNSIFLEHFFLHFLTQVPAHIFSCFHSIFQFFKAKRKFSGDKEFANFFVFKFICFWHAYVLRNPRFFKNWNSYLDLISQFFLLHLFGNGKRPSSDSNQNFNCREALCKVIFFWAKSILSDERLISAREGQTVIVPTSIGFWFSKLFCTSSRKLKKWSFCISSKMHYSSCLLTIFCIRCSENSFFIFKKTPKKNFPLQFLTGSNKKLLSNLKWKMYMPKKNYKQT